MERLIEKLKEAGVVGIDTPVFIYHLEAHPQYTPLTQAIFSGLEAGKWRAVTSVITLMEITVRPWQVGRADIARKYEALLVNFPNLAILDIQRDVTRTAAQLRARYSLRPPDALQAAASLHGGAKAFVTNDRRLSALQDLFDVLVLDDFDLR